MAFKTTTILTFYSTFRNVALKQQPRVALKQLECSHSHAALKIVLFPWFFFLTHTLDIW